MLKKSQAVTCILDFATCTLNLEIIGQVHNYAKGYRLENLALQQIHKSSQLPNIVIFTLYVFNITHFPR